MAEAENGSETQKPSKRHRTHRAGHGMVWSLTLATVILTLLALALSGRAMPLPEWARDRIEASVSERLPEGAIGIGRVAVALGRDGVPRVKFSDIAVGDTGGGAVAVLNEMQARISTGALLQGRLSPERVELDGAQVTLRRAADGRFAFVAAGAAPENSRSISDLLALLDNALAADALKSVREVEARSVVITVEDARTGRIWQATNATMILRRSGEGLTLSVASDVFNGTDNVAEVQLSFGFDHETHDTSLGIVLAEMPAADIAVQSPVLGWLGVLDAPISGAVRAEYDGESGLRSLAGTLDIAAGALSPVEGSEPLEFDSARAYFEFDNALQRIDFSELAVNSSQLALTATGQTYLSDAENGWPQAYLGQFVVSDAHLDESEWFEAPLELSDIRADLRLRLDPFSVELGQITVDHGADPIRGRGRVEARSDGWHVSVDAQTDRISPETVKAYWPINVSPITRGWLRKNVLEGVLYDASVAVRKKPGQKPDVSMNFEFQQAVVRFLEHMPPIIAASGRATINDRRFSLLMRKGSVAAEKGGTVNGAGSLFVVPDIRESPARGELTIAAQGAIEAGLSVLNNPPIRLMSRAGRGTDITDGNAAIVAVVRLPLLDDLKNEDVEYFVAGDLTSVSSKNIVPDRTLASESVTLDATPERIRLSGPATLDGVALELEWEQPLGPQAALGSRVDGTVALGPDTIRALNLPLPESLVSGRGTGVFSLALLPDAPPELTLTSDLVGLGIGIEGLSWTKARDASGTLDLHASLGDVPEVSHLALTAPGLALDGQLDFKEDGDLDVARFNSVNVGRWLDAAVRITPRGRDRSPAVTIEGGTFDLRAMPLERDSGGSDRSPIAVNLDRLIVSDSIQIAPVIGEIDAGRAGLSGAFEGRLGGRTPVRGTLAPTNGGTGVRIQTADAGGALRDAGLTPNGQNGTLDLVLTPVVGAPTGTYDGEFLIEGLHLRNAPVLADLLDAISVVGLIDQLSGPGIRFGAVDGKFRLTRDALFLRDAAAVGPSLGISANGQYDLNTKNMDIAGVISPVYFVNAVGRVLSRRGEGLFGFNYRMTGPVSDPVIGVNPLSILTPGFLREMIRGRPRTE